MCIVWILVIMMTDKGNKSGFRRAPLNFCFRFVWFYWLRVQICIFNFKRLKKEKWYVLKGCWKFRFCIILCVSETLLCVFNLLLVGTPVNYPHGIPLPDRKILELILDKLQKYVFWFCDSRFLFCLVFMIMWMIA